MRGGGRDGAWGGLVRPLTRGGQGGGGGDAYDCRCDLTSLAVDPAHFPWLHVEAGTTEDGGRRDRKRESRRKSIKVFK